MRVCMVTLSYPRYEGDFAAIFVRGVAEAVARAGVEVTVVCPHAPGCPRRETRGGVHIRRFPYFLPTSMQRLAYGSGIAANLRASRLAGVQVPLLAAAGAAAVLDASARADLIHAFWSLSGALAAPAVRWRRIPMQLKLLGSGIRSGPPLFNRIALRHADAVEFGRGSLDEELARYDYDGPVLDIRAWPFFERLDADTHLEPDLAAWCARGDAVVAFVARFVPFKDPLGVVRAVPHVLRERPGTRFLMVGDGPLRPEAQRLVGELGLGESVRLVGARYDVGPVLRASTVFVANSPVTNCFSSSILEAMYLGVPAVITDVQDPTRAFQRKDYVELVRPEDPADLARGILRLLGDGALRGRRQRIGRELLGDLGFDHKVILERTLASYENLCRRRGRPRGCRPAKEKRF